MNEFFADFFVENDAVIWNFNKGDTLRFEKTAYLTLIKNAANDFSWENKERTAERLVGEVFRDTKLNDGYCFDWASARIRKGKISLSFSKEASQKFIDFDWVDENPESAVVSAVQFKIELLP